MKITYKDKLFGTLRRAKKLTFHLSAKKACDGLTELLLRFAHSFGAFIQQNHYTAHQIPLRQNRGGNAKKTVTCAFRGKEFGSAGVAIGLSLLHNMIQL